MEQTIFIKDMSNKAIGDHIGRLCVMADIEPPEDGKSIVEFLRDKFWKYDANVIPNAFDTWMAGKYPDIMRVKKINMVFLSLILNEFIQNNYHKIQRYSPPALPPPPPSTEELERIAQRSLEMTTNEWLVVYRDKRMERLSMKLMEINWNRIVAMGENDNDFDEHEIKRMMEFLNDYDARYTAHISKQLGNKNKEKRFMDVMNAVSVANRHVECMRAAAKFAIYTNKKFGIK